MQGSPTRADMEIMPLALGKRRLNPKAMVRYIFRSSRVPRLRGVSRGRTENTHHERIKPAFP